MLTAYAIFRRFCFLVCPGCYRGGGRHKIRISCSKCGSNLTFPTASPTRFRGDARKCREIPPRKQEDCPGRFGCKNGGDIIWHLMLTICITDAWHLPKISRLARSF